MMLPCLHRLVGSGALHRCALVAGMALGGAGLSSPSRAAPSPRPAPAADAVPAEPAATSATYGDWVYRCQKLAGEEGGRVCEVAQTIQAKGQAAPVAQIAVGRLPGQASLHVTVLLPPNASFPSAVRVSDGKDGGPDLDLPWRKCLPGACIADAHVTEAVLAGWRKSAEPGRITFKDAEGREIAISLSFRGFAPALDALAREKS